MATRPARASLDLAVEGMDCADCALHVEQAVAVLPGVEEVCVLLAAERASVTFDPQRVTPAQIRAAIAEAGYRVPEAPGAPSRGVGSPRPRQVGTVVSWGVLALVAGAVLAAALGERLGLLDAALARLPWWLPALAVLAGGWPVFREVLHAAARRRVTSHTLMSLGVLAAAAIGQWTTAALVVFFMRFADWIEGLVTARSRQALAQLVALQPATARVRRSGGEVVVPLDEVAPGEVVVVRPGERIPVDGEVIAGRAPVDQAPITGESLPVEKGAGDPVFAATVVQAGYLELRATRVRGDTTFARIVRLVEEAEAHKAPVQRFADRFSAYYLPAVLAVAGATLLISGQVVNAVAVLVVACACAIALATPVVVLASVSSAARAGVLIKGGSALEALARVDTVVMDKTGTLTLGEPRVTDVIPLDGRGEAELLAAAAAVEGRSEHPLARAIVRVAAERGLVPAEPAEFTPLPGRGAVATVGGRVLAMGNPRLLAERGLALSPEQAARAEALAAAGRSVVFVAEDGRLAGLLGVADVLRPEVTAAVAELRRLGIRRLLLLTGDHARVAAAIAGELGLEYRAELLPEEKIAAVEALQAGGAVVMMVGDGVNDAPALARADVGVAMGAVGTDVAIETADVVLMRDDWRMVPEVIRIGRRAARTIRQNLAFAALYNLVGLSLAALGLLPPVWAAAAQSLPDVVIMLNSSRLLRRPGR